MSVGPMRSVPLLPCASIDDVVDLWVALGMHVDYRQDEPRGYLRLAGFDGAELHYFDAPDHEPERTGGGCVLVVDDAGAWFERWSVDGGTFFGDAGRAQLVGPHVDAGGHTVGFSVVDPAGNRIRVVGETRAEPDDQSSERPSAYERHGVAAAPHHRFSALIYLAELSVRLGRLDDARAHLAAAEQIIPDSPAIAMVREGMQG